jgi:hypothetical protein
MLRQADRTIVAQEFGICWCTTKKLFYLELMRNRQFHRLFAEESQSVLPRPLSQTQETMKNILQ